MNSIHDCIFCSIIAGKIPATLVTENEHAIVIKDIAPKAPVHYLIIPKMHVTDVMSLNDEQRAIIVPLFALAQNVGAEAREFRLIINNGKTAGQSVFHLHMHLLAGLRNSELA